MTKPRKPNFSPEFRLETAQLIVDNGYTHKEAAKAMSVGYSTIGKWVKQLREERQDKSPKATRLTPEQIEIRELKKRIERIELVNIGLLVNCWDYSPMERLFRSLKTEWVPKVGY